MEQNQKMERRNHLVTNNESRHIEGYAAVFNKESKDLGGFIEVILPGAFDGTIEKSDVLALLNHQEERGVLARSKFGEGSLKLTIDEIGLKYEFDAPNMQIGDELLEGIKRGDISTSSFAFTVAEDEIINRNDTIYRYIKKIDELFDISPVYREAYPDTSVAQRSINNFVISLESYYKDLKDNFYK